MSDHSIVIDLQLPGSPRFECNAPDGAPCKAQWECECETIWGYRVVGGSPVHDTTMEGADGLGNAIHVGRFDNTRCNLTEWHDNQDEAVEGTVRVDVKPVNEIDYVTFTATSARIEKDS
ncbi:hypothetical protein [Brevibacterium sediminis]|uniref:hypothetical protein n=1 Tax=Brevibacterium sediminis TaxID=1857024 RepID=UPI00366C1257